ncbi:hypothetical protein BVG16_32035 [Paenibacillus selenitireducens]|uniref:Carrier domain-containing protein n=1 Tax=Paenibacillus selenitireducens TaxID=1324314 RepID=A0A1T2WZN9_9BACL|nr:non-ribosomal peptide synthetase [Paenibacillus selenitireducens]OPA72813.1 hypothetical protein BVG16_32035 [Paenibacillus selenitireducens]
MSSTQKRTYFICQMDDAGVAYNMPRVIRMTGEVCPEAIREAMQEMINRHEILRTEFLMKEDEPVQKIREDVMADYKYIENRETSEEDIIKDFIKPFDLGKAPLFRAELVKRENHYLFMLDTHHIVSDGTSIGTFLNEFATLYNGEALQTVARQYKDYSEWMSVRDLSDQKKHWLDEFSGEIPVLDLPTDYARKQEMSLRGATKEIKTTDELGEKIKKLAEESGTTEYMIFLSAAMILLSNYSRQEDIVIGSPIIARTHKDTEGMLGMFVNTLAMRGAPEGNKTYEAFLEEIKEKCLRAFENQDYPFEELVESLKVTRDMSRNPLFDVMLTLQNNEKAKYHLNGIEVDYIDAEEEISKFNLSFTISEIDKKYEIMMEYCTDLYKKETADLMISHYNVILEQIVENRYKQIKEIEVITEEERSKILGEFNNTQVEYPMDKTVIGLFEEQVKNTPENVAVIYEDEKITYAELNQRSNQLARKLRKLGVKPNDFVAMLTERSIEMIIGIYGIMKAGGAYVPIDPEFPEERIKYILEDCEPKAVLVYKAVIDTELPVIDLFSKEICIEETTNLQKVNTPEDLAYSIYTSGTTGKPKGVLIEHKGLRNLMAAYTEIYNLSSKDTVLQAANYIFDQSVWDIFNILLVGGTLCLISRDDVRTPSAIERCCKRNHVTIAAFTPVMITELDADKFPNLGILESGGGTANAEILKKWVKNREVINTYGPTEITVNASSYRYNGEDVSNIPIGKPIANMKYYVINGSNNMCGIAIPGELCIAGPGVARGYLNNSVLTAEKFIKNPFGEGRIYKTGDLARWLPDGNIECLGRIDEQVKIRGYRIELGEIENAIRRIDDIRDCAVIAKTDDRGDKEIYAYIVSEREVNTSEIRDKLGITLPEYMIPAYIARIETIPMTRSGKLDRRALPDIETRSEREYVAPTTEEEKVLCKAFSEILGIEKVGADDNFFELGGDSIKSIRVVSRVREAGYELTVRDIMRKNVVKVISQTMTKAVAIVYNQGETVGKIKPTPIIRDFGNSNYKVPNYYNQSTIIRLEKWGTEAIKKALDAVVKHHDILRSVYRENTLEILSILEGKLYDYYEIDAGEDGYIQRIEEECTQIQSSINLTDGPLVKAAKISTMNGKYLFVCIHHLVVDGVSWRILTEDIVSGINQAEAGRKIVLPQKTASFKEWSEALDEYRKSKKLEKERVYWNKIVNDLSYGMINSEETGEDGYGKITIEFERELTENLLYKSGRAYNTEINDLLLTALGMAAKELTGQSKLLVMLEGHGREEIHKKIDIDRTVGWFTSEYPVIVESNENVEENIINTKEMLRKVPNHGMGYGLLMEEHKEVSIIFNYMGEMDAERKETEIEHLYVGRNVSEENQFNEPVRFNGEAVNGCLSFDITFDKRQYSIETISRFAERYKRCLEDVVITCVSQKFKLNTASDWSASDLESGDYLEILNSIS